MNKIEESIVKRYTSEAEEGCCLSCGNNLVPARLKKGEVLVDIGSGAGSEAISAARLVGPAGRVVGVDMTPEMIRTATRTAERFGMTNVEFILGEAENLPLPDDMADVVISNCVINHAQDKERVYREIYRVLKPGGRFVISDVISRDELPPEIKDDPQYWAECFGGAVTEDQYFAAIRAAGFESIETLSRREYTKHGYPMASLTIRGMKPVPV